MSSFPEVLNRLAGLEAWSTFAVRGSGSHVSIHCGRRVPRARSLSNPSISEEARAHEGEWILFIQNAPWRLANAERVVCSWNSSNAPGGEMIAGLKQVEGRRIISARTRPPSHDLFIDFGGGWELVIFCERMDAEEHGDSYTLLGPGVAVTVGERGHIQWEER
jgi:hypothetical protein